MWLQDENQEIPEWMKPDEANAILTSRTIDDISYIELIEAGAPMKADVLSWAIQYTLNNKLNLYYQVNGGWNKIGNTDFLEARL